MSDDTDVIREIVTLNELVHTPVRLAILLFLLSRPIATFPEVKSALGVTSGNLSSHIKRLERGGMIFVEKNFVNLKPTTQLRITSDGIQAVEEYKSMLRKMLDTFDS